MSHQQNRGRGRDRGQLRERGGDRGQNRGRGGDRGRERGRGGPQEGRGGAPVGAGRAGSSAAGGALPGGRGGDFGGGPPGGSGVPPPSRGGRGQRDFRGSGPPRGGPMRGGGRGGIFAENVPAIILSRLSDANTSKVIKSFNTLAADPNRPLRPGYGTLGEPITLRANFFRVRVPSGPIFDYTVEITPKTPKTDVNSVKARLFFLLEQSAACQPFLGHIAHDRSERIVSAKKLPQPLNISVPFYEEGEKGPQTGATVYTLSITLKRELDIESLTKFLNAEVGSRDYNTLPIVSALNLVLQQHPTRTGVRVGQNKYFFPTSSRYFQLSTGIVAFQGFYTSVRPISEQLAVNVNSCMTAFIQPGNLADALFAFGRNTSGAMPNLPKGFAKSVKVTTNHLGYKMRKPIKAIASTSASDTFFDCEEFGGPISVENYFLKKYKIKLAHAKDLPVVDIGARKTNYIPAELCEIEWQAYHGKLSQTETAQMIKYACNPPRFNAEAITTDGFALLGMNPVKTPVDGFNIGVDTEMAVIPGRELRPPRLTYSKGNANVKNGSWNIMNVKLHRGAFVKSWGVLVVRDGKDILQSSDDARLETLVTRFREKLQRSGVQIPDGLPNSVLMTKPLRALQDASREAALAEIRKVLTTGIAEAGNKKPDFILVLLSHHDNYIYPGIKRMGDVDLGVHTIHMQLSKALGDERKQDQYLSNVCLKVNSKLGGINHLLDSSAMGWLTTQKTMMVGIDVTHPGPDSRKGAPSIAAVVASVDDNFVQFPASLRIQKPDPNRESKEMLSELRDMLVERLLLYERKNEILPQRIIIFRDGVSEGQFDIVIREEKAQILEAFKKLNTAERGPEPYRPLFSIVICGKRHHARFYPTSSTFADKNGNTRPGTVVDKGVTAVFDFDFYLQAHAGIQGTVKPTHYTVVYDELKFTADELQQGSNDFSYLYARATKAVSLIPAAYYADLACERGRYYLNEYMVDDKASKATSSGKGKSDREEERTRVFNAARQAWGQGIHPDIRDSMFYI